MASNRYTSLGEQEYHSIYQPVDFNEIYQLGLLKEKQFEQGQAEADALSNSILSIKSIDEDKSLAKALSTQYERELNKIIEANKGDYSRAVPELRSLKNRITKDKTVGQWSAIDNRLASEQAFQKYLADESKSYDPKKGTGISPHEANQAFLWNKKQQKPLEQDSVGNWTGYSTIPIGPTRNIQDYMLEIGKNMDIQEISTLSGLKVDPASGGQYFIDVKTGTKVRRADAVAQATLAYTMNDPEMMDYVNTRNKFTGKEDAFRQAQAQNNNFLGTDNQGNQISRSPDRAAMDILYNDLTEASRNVGEILKRNSFSEDAQYKDNGEYISAADRAKNNEGKDLFRYSLPASTTNTAGVPDKVYTNSDGSVIGQGTSSVVASGIQNAVETGKSAVQGIFGIMQLTNPFFFNPAQGQENLAKSKMNEVLSKVPNADKQKLIDNSAKELRTQFPKLAELYPESKQKNDKGSFDANAAKVVNHVHESMMQNQTIVNHVDIPSDPVKNSVKTQLFNTNTFNKLNYKLSTGVLDTKQEAIEQTGPVTKEKLEKAEFNGFGGFADPGSIYAQIPNDAGEMVNITIEPDETTKQIYTHSTEASKAYKTGKSSTRVQSINDGTGTKQYVFDYIPEINENGMSIKIKQYEYLPETKDKKGKLISEDDAFNVYSQEYGNWITTNKYNLK